MEKRFANILGGLAGAVALNILHEVYRHYDAEAPRADLLGEEAITKTLDAADLDVPEGNTMYLTNLASDLVSNAFLFSAVGLGKDKNLWLKGLSVGLGVGLSTLAAPKLGGLDAAPVMRTHKTTALTVLWYVVGGLATAATIRLLRK